MPAVFQVVSRGCRAIGALTLLCLLGAGSVARAAPAGMPGDVEPTGTEDPHLWTARLELEARHSLPGSGQGQEGAELAPQAGNAPGEHWLVRLEGPDLWESLVADRAPSVEEPGAGIGDAQSEPSLDRGEAVERAALEQARDRLRARQQAVVSQVEELGLAVLSRYQLTDNALLIAGDADRARQVAVLAGVESLLPVPLLAAQLGRVRQHVGAERAILETGLDGAGSLIAVLDTGVDYTHAALGGPGSIEAYLDNDPRHVEAGSFPTAKVVGGVDLAGSRYAADCPRFPPPALACTRQPQPDDDPLDEVHPEGMPGQGHGTHTASIAAGDGLLSTQGAGIAPGIAPAAQLVAIKIFGAPRSSDPSYTVGQTALLLDGLEWILAHNLGLEVAGLPAETEDGQRRGIDVASLSLGASWGAGLAAYEPALERLAEAGVTVVASAGNDGDRPFVLGAPAVGSQVLAVGASHAPGEKQPQFRATWGPRSIEEAAVEAEDQLTPRLADIGPIEGRLAWYGEACDDREGQPSPPVQPVEGRIALIERGDCLFVDKLDNAQQLGAIGVVVYTNEAPVRAMEGICGTTGRRCFDIPAVMIARDPGLDLRIAALGPDPVTATLGLALLPDIADRVYEGSSRGPARRGDKPGPQVVAPGSAVLAAGAGTGDGRRSVSGTSQAAPAVAGASALLRQRARRDELTLSALDLAALLSSQALPVIHNGKPQQGPIVPVARQGAGLLQVDRAAAAEILLRSQDGIAELGFGTLHLDSGALRESRQLELRNLGAQARDLAIGARFLFEEDREAGVFLDFEPDRLRLPAGGRATITASLSVDANGMRPWTLTGLGRSRLLSNPDFGRFETDGYVEVEEVDDEGQPLAEGQSARMPFYSLPHRHSCMEAEADHVDLPPGAEASLALRNDCVEAGGAAAYLQAAADEAEAEVPAALDIRRVGLRHFRLPESARDPEYPQLRLQVVEMIVQTAGERRTPLDARFRAFFDIDRDGVWDRVGQVETFEGPRFGSFVTPVDPSSLEPDWAGLPRNPSSGAIRFFVSDMPYDLDEQVSVLRFFANHPVYGIGVDLEAGDAAFDFAIEAADALGDHPITEDFPGFDHAPNDLSRGGRYRFRQAAWDCLQVDCPDCDLPIDGSAGELADLAPSGGRLQLRLRACPMTEDALPAALLIHAATDKPEASLEVLELSTGAPTLHLPLLLRDGLLDPARP